MKNCRVDAALIAALMCTIHCWLIFCISPHPGTMGPPYTIGRAKHDDNAMRSALVSIRSDGSDLLLPRHLSRSVQSRAAILQWAAAAAPSVITCSLVHLWKLAGCALCRRTAGQLFSVCPGFFPDSIPQSSYCSN